MALKSKRSKKAAPDDVKDQVVEAVPVDGPESPTLDDLEKAVSAATKATVMRLAMPSKRLAHGLSSGSMELNTILSGNPFVGYAWGRMIEAYGPEGCGKTTLALHGVVEAQKLDVPSMYVDAEHALDAVYAETLGVKLDRMSFSQPDSGEEGLEVVEAAVTNGYKYIVVDSVASLTPQAEIDGNMGDSHVGLHARLMGQAMRKLAGRVSKKGAIVFFINQLRYKVGVMFGNPETTPGGNALRFYASYRLDMRAPREGKIVTKDLKGDVEIGKNVNVTVVKNKLYPPYKKASFRLLYGMGIDKYVDAARVMNGLGLFAPDKKGTPRIVMLDKSYTLNTLSEALSGSPELRKEAVKLIKSKL